MKGDFSRDSFDKAKHFSRVLMQQGRVQLDADWNEQAVILLHYMRTLAADLIGSFAGPAGDDFGFKVTDPGAGARDFMLGKGRYYVDGILCENDAVNASYKNQQDFPHPPLLDRDRRYLVYLDVWERHITAAEDDSIREKALGGLDTASRTKVIWQAKVEDVSNTGDLGELTSDNVRNKWGVWIERWQPPHRGILKATVKRSDEFSDPCLSAPDAKYRGTENQLYRVEIHKGGSASEATFKWSRDNGAIVTGCELNGIELTVHNPRGFAPNQLVELTNDEQELRGEYGALVKLVKVEGDVLTLESTPSASFTVPQTETWPTKVRRWDHSEKGELMLQEDGAVLVQEGAAESDWIEVEDGIQIQFLPSEEDRNRYRTGDYWLIPARVATGYIEWPVEEGANENTNPISQPPHGIRHHYAPLAILTWQQDEWTVDDCRCNFEAANQCESGNNGENGTGEASVRSKPSALRPGKSVPFKREGHPRKKPKP